MILFILIFDQVTKKIIFKVLLDNNYRGDGYQRNQTLISAIQYMMQFYMIKIAKCVRFFRKVFIRFNSRSAASSAVKDLWGTNKNITVPSVIGLWKKTGEITFC